MKECDLFHPVKSWLEHQGYKVFAEMYGHDVLAVKQKHLIVVELKLSFTRHLLRQCSRAHFADTVYAAVPTTPSKKSMEIRNCNYSDIGILQVRDSVVVLHEPDLNSPFNRSDWLDKKHDKICDLLGSWTPDDAVLGGVPTGVNEGPAQKVLRLVREHRGQFPASKWRDLYRIVPNHYASHKSMQQSMSKCEEFERIRQRKALTLEARP